MSDVFSCLACAKPMAETDPWYPDVSGTLCAGCAPTYADLLDDNGSFVDLKTEEPLSAAARLALFDAHIAAGGKPDDSMAGVS